MATLHSWHLMFSSKEFGAYTDENVAKDKRFAEEFVKFLSDHEAKESGNMLLCGSVCLSGIIQGDEKGRFADRTRITTSRIVLLERLEHILIEEEELKFEVDIIEVVTESGSRYVIYSDDGDYVTNRHLCDAGRLVLHS